MYSTNYENIKKSYKLEKTDGKYVFNGEGWISFVLHNALKLETLRQIDEFKSIDETSTFINLATSTGSNISFNSNLFYYVKNSAGALDKEEVEKIVKIGDILIEVGGHRAGIYEGGNIAYCSEPSDDSESCLKEISLYPGKDESSRTIFQNYCAIIRIKEEAANKLETGNVTSLLEEDHIQEDKEYGKYYGTTQGAYVGSYTFNLFDWIFKALIDCMDFLMGLIAYLIRAPFVGWANILENMINDTINNVSGIKITENPENSNQQTRTIEGDNPSAKDVYISKRINIEDIVFNNVPLLDVNIFDLNLSKYTSSGLISISSDSILFKMREIVATWYYIIRNIAIISMLLILIYLGIRVAIASTGEKKAGYKKMMVAWVTSFIIIFTIHYFMILVIDGNELLVNKFKDANITKEAGIADAGMSLYDTIRTRAYSMKLSEGMPATIMYMVLIYLMIKYLYAYLKRYLVVNILALLAPFIAIKYGFESINKGGNNTGAIVAWMSDFALNVFLQSMHAILYTIFMSLAYEQAFKSVSGFVLALIIMNYMFKAEELFRKVLDFNGRAGSMDNVTKDDSKDVREKGLYALKTAAKFSMIKPITGGIGLIKNSSKIVDGIGQAGSDLVNILSGGKVDLSEAIKAKDKEEDKNGKAFLNRLDDGFYNLTGERSLGIGLQKLKEKDPELYKKRKAMLKNHSKKKREVMKRSLKEGFKPIGTLAKAMTAVPMMVVDPKYGFHVLVSTGHDLEKMAHKNEIYGYRHKKSKDKKEIWKNRGKKFAMITLPVGYFGYSTTRNNYKKLRTDLNKIRENERKIQDLRTAETLKTEIEEDIEIIDKKYEGDSEYEKMKAQAIEVSINSVLTGRNLYGAVTNYMKRNKITKLTDADFINLFREFNIEGIDAEIAKLNLKDTAVVDGLKSKVAELREELKENVKNANEIKETLNEITQTENRIANAERKRRLRAKIVEAIKASEVIGEGMFKASIVESTITEYEGKGANKKVITEKDIPKIVELYKTKVKANMFISKETLKQNISREKKTKETKANGSKTAESKATEGKKSGNKTTSSKTKSSTKAPKEMDRKEAVDRLLTMISEEPIPKVSKETFTSKASFGQEQVKYGELESVAQKVKRLKALSERTKNRYGSSVIDMEDFRYGIIKKVGR